MTRAEAAAKIAGALEAVAGLRLAAPADVAPELVRVQLIATRLPIPPLLDHAAAVVRPVLAGTEWAQARLRLEVSDLDRAAFG